ACSRRSPWPASAWRAITSGARSPAGGTSGLSTLRPAPSRRAACRSFPWGKSPKAPGSWGGASPSFGSPFCGLTTTTRVAAGCGERKKPPEQPNCPRRTVFLLVDSFDLATLAAMRYARSLKPTTLRAVHFVIDTAEADALRQEWSRGDRGIVLDFIDCPDRRLARAAAELVSAEAPEPGTHVTAVLPPPSHSPLP